MVQRDINLNGLRKMKYKYAIILDWLEDVNNRTDYISDITCDELKDLVIKLTKYHQKTK